MLEDNISSKQKWKEASIAIPLSDKIDFKPKRVTRQRDLGSLCLGGSLKSWGTGCGPNPSLFREWLRVEGSPLIVWCSARYGIYGVNVSQSFPPVLMWYFLFSPIYRSHSASFWIPLRGACSLCSCTFSDSVGGRKSRSLQCCHLSPTSSLLLSFF